jgi:hypothetical protein
MKRLIILVLFLAPLWLLAQDGTVIEPKINAQTIMGLDTSNLVTTSLPNHVVGQGTNGQILQTDGSGVLTWITNAAFSGVIGVDASNISSVNLYRANDTISESFGHLHNEYKLVTETIYLTDVSNPPTDAELDAAFGTPATVGKRSFYIDDAGGGTNFYKIISDGTSWWIFTGTKAL